VFLVRSSIEGMGTKSREVIFGGQVRAAKMKAERARKLAEEAIREADYRVDFRCDVVIRWNRQFHFCFPTKKTASD
jgi:hypothetical protein